MSGVPSERQILYPAVPGEAPGARYLRRPRHPRKARITNGYTFLPYINPNNKWVRRCRAIIRTYLVDLGGEDNISTAEYAIIRRCAVLSAELEHLEVRFASSTAASAEDLQLYVTTTNCLRRLLEAIGLQRRPREIVPDPLSYARDLTIDGDAP